MKQNRAWEIFTLKPKSNKPLTLTHVSLFSGCGGFDLGFHQAGFKTIFANDTDIDACQTYRANIGKIIDDDINAIEIPKFSNPPDVLTAGFPCQPFSNAGSRKGVSDKRGTLYQTAIEFIRKIKPKSVVFENVRGLLSFKSGQKLLIQEICARLNELGYDIVFSLIDASRHHVPQKRLRVFIVGIENSSKGHFMFPAPINKEDLTLKHTIFDLKDNVPNQKEILRMSPQSARLGTLVPEGGSWKDIPYQQLPERLQKIRNNMQRYHSPKFYRRFHSDEVAGTITASFTPENSGVWHPTESRVFSVRECARIQSFPDWFCFEGRTLKSKYKQIGNAVPPRLAYEIAKNVRAALEGKDLRGDAEYITFEQFVSSGKPLRACDRNVIFSNK